MAIRVLRLLEYVYDTPETMVKDMEHWQVQRVEKHSDMTIRSTTLPAEILTDNIDEVGKSSSHLSYSPVDVEKGRGFIEEIIER